MQLESSGSGFFGRESELLALRAGVDNAIVGQGRLVFLVGEPGIGKTRTCEEVAAYARGRGAQVLWGRCYEGEGAPAFWPWVQVIRAAARPLAADQLHTALGPGAADVAHVAPELRARLPDLPAAVGVEAAQARFRVFDSITQFMANVAHRAPLAVILDDLQGADPSSLLLLQFVVHQLRDMPVLVLATCRAGALQGEHPLVTTFAEALREPGTQRVTLGGLSEADVAQFVESTTGVRASGALLRALHKHTEGNPLFVTEYVRALVAEDRLLAEAEGTGLTVSLPEGVKAVIGRRVALLSQECQEMLGVASVIGREFHLDVLARVGAAAPHGAPPHAALDEAVTARILIKVSAARPRYRFGHALFNETLYDALSPTRRMELHRLIGQALEQDADQPLAELAHHFFEADSPAAAAYARRAGDRALGLVAYEEAARLYQVAVRAVEKRGLRSAADDGERAELLLSVADAQMRAGQRAQAHATYQQAAALARQIERPDVLARAALGSAGGGWAAEVRDEISIRLLEEALDALGEQDSILRARLIAALVFALLADSTQHEKTVQLSEQAVDIARSVGDQLALGYALRARHMVLWGLPNLEERLAVSCEALQLAAGSSDPDFIIACRDLRLRDLLDVGEMHDLDRETQLYSGDAQRLRQPLYLGLTANLAGVRALLDGRFADSERLATECFALLDRVNSDTARQIFSVQLFFVRREQGRLDELEPIMRAAVEQYPALRLGRTLLAYALSELNREAEARSEFERLAPDDGVPRHQNRVMHLALLSEVCAFLGDRRRAQALYDALAPYDGRSIIPCPLFACFGSVSHTLGRLAATLRHWDDATQHFEASLRMHKKMGARPFPARTESAYAGMLCARGASGDREQALDLLELALATTRELGMKSLEENVTAQRSAISDQQPVSRAPRSARSDQHREGSDQEPARNVFRKDGDYWTIGYDAHVLRLKDTKGLRYLAHLLQRPGQEFLALDLVDFASRNGDGGYIAPQSAIAGASVDTHARRQYAARLHELRDELAEAQANHDIGRSEHVRAEIETLAAHLRGALGLGGRDRPSGSALERARSAVGKRIRGEIKRIRAAHPRLGRHLAATITIGTFCAYKPEADALVDWQL